MIAPVRDRGVGEHVLDVEHERRRAGSDPRPSRSDPSVSGGDIARITSTRRNQPPARSAAMPASTENPTNPSARRNRLRLSSPGNGCDPGDRSPTGAARGGSTGPSSPARSRARGTRAARDDVQLVPERGQLVRRCGSSPRRSVRCRARSAGRARRSSRFASAFGCQTVCAGERPPRGGDAEVVRDAATPSSTSSVAARDGYGHAVGPGLRRRSPRR